MNLTGLDIYRKNYGEALHVLPGRNPFAGVVPYVKLVTAFGLGALAMALLIVVTPS